MYVLFVSEDSANTLVMLSHDPNNIEPALFSQELDDLRIDWSGEVEPNLVFFQSIMKPVEDRVDN